MAGGGGGELCFKLALVFFWPFCLRELVNSSGPSLLHGVIVIVFRFDRGILCLSHSMSLFRGEGSGGGGGRGGGERGGGGFFLNIPVLFFVL